MPAPASGSPSGPSSAPASAPAQALKRELGVPGATLLGLGSIVGTGVFVSLGLGAGVAGPAVVLAIALAGLLATCNALSSAQLAASWPTSGGTYEYGHVYLRPWVGFVAGWMFLCAKSASAATAALGFASYLLGLLDRSSPRVGIALAAVVVITATVLGGMRRSNAVNAIIVGLTLASLVVFVALGAPLAAERAGDEFVPFFAFPGSAQNPSLGTMARSLAEATALMFVAYTGYGRIATMGEEVRDPRATIPRAIVLTLVVSMVLYVSVALVGVGAAGAEVFSSAVDGERAPLAVVADSFGVPWAGTLVAVGGATAMLGVLLNLVLGLSRVALAMGRRGDLPAAVGRLDARGTTPRVAVLLVAAIVLGLVSVGSIRLAWSFSAFTVLVYYGITNLAALRLPRPQRLYPAGFAWGGLLGCFGLAFLVEPRVWMVGLGVLAAGLVLRAGQRWFSARRTA